MSDKFLAWASMPFISKEMFPLAKPVLEKLYAYGEISWYELANGDWCLEFGELYSSYFEEWALVLDLLAFYIKEGKAIYYECTSDDWRGRLYFTGDRMIDQVGEVFYQVDYDIYESPRGFRLKRATSVLGVK